MGVVPMSEIIHSDDITTILIIETNLTKTFTIICGIDNNTIVDTPCGMILLISASALSSK